MLKSTVLWLLAPTLLLAACASIDSLRRDYPLAPTGDYEMLLAGNLEAGFVGDENCLSKCHVHERIQRDFTRSIHGEQLSAETGLPLVNCESCHGPGSLAIERAGETGKCDFTTFLQLEELPARAQSLLCLKCHSAASTPILHNWNSSTHANSDVSCFDCHKLHQGPQQKVGRRQQNEMCMGCHPGVRSEFTQFSRHPVLENKMACSDCHNPHGTDQEHMLRASTVKERCTRCHMEFQGPFVFEHADITQDCTNCHHPHGSPNEPLLNVTQPFLCLQCHTGHLDSRRPALSTPEHKAAFYSRCTDCHSTIHGTNLPSAKGRGTFMAR